jgi:L-2,4-diaminobutyrate transaminase
MSAAIVSEKVYQVLEVHADRTGPFSHGYTYSGHPIGAAVANTVLDILEREKLAENAAETGAYFLKQMKDAVADLPIVGEVRGSGMLLAIELVAGRQAKVPFSPDLKVAAQIAVAMRARGLIARALPVGNILGFAPPLVATKGDIDSMVSITAAAVHEVMSRVQ